MLWPKKLAALLGEPGELSEQVISAAHVRLAAAFPKA